ncbi:hypothetical protein F5148DRAFT_46816 [Russula earlei]|uniref:Uncharacterized protein n=1 Tax=Russula earlei TaxID=71964 RepID=A0ACC0U8V8_9AGAM|nr:hypothetical protein F5148DRAFT_46816 [Russula earlei]
MRRFASVLSSRRLDKPESQPPPDPSPASPPSSQPNRKSSRRFFGTLTRITVSTERPIRPSEPTHSSSASSTGSVSLRTPEDDRTGHLAPRSPSSRKAWVTWLTPKKPDVQPPIRPSSFRSDSSSPVPSPQPAPPRIIPGQQSESEEDTSEESSSSESDIPSQSPPIAARSHQVNRSLTPIEFLQTLTTNNIPPLSPPPLLHCPNAPLFPRSLNVSRSLPFRDTVEAAMHRTRLLHRLERGPLTPADQRLLARLGYRTSSVAERRTLVQPEEWERYDLRHVRPSSLGLKQWIARPYFEERSVVWVPDETGTVVWTTIQGSGFGVWALEVSDRIELMADLVSDGEDMSTVGMLAARSPSNSAVPPSLSAVGKLVPYKAVPSPLRSDTTPTDPPMSSSSSEFMPATSAVSSPRRGVRFADNLDKEDQVPLGYVLRHRKRREEKTLFIQREQERREHEEEKRRHEAERQQWEQEKRQWQKEKRSIEEAKRQKQYAEEINAARVRRETLYVLPSSQAREQDRKPREAYSRPVYDPRRQIEPLSQAHQPHPRNDSSSSSKQGNLPQSESAGLLTSRPASTHSIASSEDIRSRVSRNSRRGSMISESSQRSVTSPYHYVRLATCPTDSSSTSDAHFPFHSGDAHNSSISHGYASPSPGSAFHAPTVRPFSFASFNSVEGFWKS